MGEIATGGKSCGKLRFLLQRCENPVQKSFSISLMNAHNHPVIIGRTAERDQATDSSPDMTGKLIYDERAQHFQNKLDEWIFEHGRWIMALSCAIEKAGKSVTMSSVGGPRLSPYNFSRLPHF